MTWTKLLGEAEGEEKLRLNLRRTEMHARFVESTTFPAVTVIVSLLAVMVTLNFSSFALLVSSDRGSQRSAESSVTVTSAPADEEESRVDKDGSSNEVAPSTDDPIAQTATRVAAGLVALGGVSLALLVIAVAGYLFRPGAARAVVHAEIALADFMATKVSDGEGESIKQDGDG